MKADESPFPSGWYGTSLECVGLKEQRPNVGTYGLYEFSNLPLIDKSFDGSFNWLDSEVTHSRNIGNEMRTSIQKSIIELTKSCESIGTELPRSFIQFLTTLHLHNCIRSATDCFLDPSNGPVQSPIGDGFLIRFLADSQACGFWYLYIPKKINDHCVVMSHYFFDPDYDRDNPPDGFVDGVDPNEIVFCAPSFEEFLYRFWLENELSFSYFNETQQNLSGKKYIEQYSTAPADKLYIDSKMACRVCGKIQPEPPWGEDGASPTYSICDCCGVEFGYEDANLESLRRYRNNWLATGMPWFRPKEKPNGWSYELQFMNVPQEFR